MPKAFSEHERKIIHQRLLEQGYALFSVHGLRKTNVEEIAQAAGISKGAFYSFYQSKEALLMDVTEEAEQRFRLEMIAGIDRPGPSPRARLFRILREGFALLDTLPLLQLLSGGDFDLLVRRVPPEILQEHLASDQAFFEDFVARCRAMGIPIRVSIEQILGLLYPLVLAHVHRDDFGPYNLRDSLDTLLELIAAYCLGEVEVRV